MTPEQGLAYATEIAQFRFALIAPLIQGLAPDASSTAYFKRVTKEPLTLPNGETVLYSWKTPQKWYSLYSKGGFDALMPKTRSDKGVPRSLNDTAMGGDLPAEREIPPSQRHPDPSAPGTGRVHPGQCQRRYRTALYPP